MWHLHPFLPWRQHAHAPVAWAPQTSLPTAQAQVQAVLVAVGETVARVVAVGEAVARVVAQVVVRVVVWVVAVVDQPCALSRGHAALDGPRHPINHLTVPPGRSPPLGGRPPPGTRGAPPREVQCSTPFLAVKLRRPSYCGWAQRGRWCAGVQVAGDCPPLWTRPRAQARRS